jgi:hypothetical protein
MKKFWLLTLVLTIATPLQAQADVRVGTLSCDVAPTTSFVVGSRQALTCVYDTYRGRQERYAGRISRFGADLGFTSGKKLVWVVVAPAPNEQGALSGLYIGASGEVTVGVGAHANALFGGFGRSVSLQPVSVGVQQGLSAAAAVSELELLPLR